MKTYKKSSDRVKIILKIIVINYSLKKENEVFKNC